MGYPSYPDSEPEHDGDGCEWIARAELAEQEYALVRAELQGFIQWLAEPTRGPVIFRSEVVERLCQILAP